MHVHVWLPADGRALVFMRLPAEIEVIGGRPLKADYVAGVSNAQ